ncbi:MAG: trypsin-like peptidase domain-containing protein [Oscillatoria sp. SIO1A7]|nr:trypsin-like peptidase domain-containing protein [Oscillatoria sp. SIO1A7]
MRITFVGSLLLALLARSPNLRSKVLSANSSATETEPAEPALAETSLPPSLQNRENELHQQARAIAVRVLSEVPLGSGTIIQRQGSVYTVVTNKHVLRGGNSPYWIRTADGRDYPADPVNAVGLEGYDLALLQFRSTRTVYAVARLGSSSSLQVGDEVFAAGFPWKVEGQSIENENNRENEELILPSAFQPLPSSQGFILRMGRVSLVLDKALQEGYRIGYTNNVEKGMSGGPLLNRRGEVVGINGMHAYPLWDAPDLYEDGSEPSPSLQPLIVSSSWAIPIETATERREASSLVCREKLSYWSIVCFILQMQAETEAGKSCREF